MPKKKELVFPKTWEDFCKQTGRDPVKLPDVSAYDERDKKHAVADFKLTHMIRYVNADKVDHTNSSQTKYEIWWWITKDSSGSGLGLSYSRYANWDTITGCGPRFCFLNYDHMKQAAEDWIDLFKDLIL
jgi:hypothetical protein